MTLTLDKLRALKRQAGATDTPASPASSVPSSLREPLPATATAPVAPWDAVLHQDATSRIAANDPAPHAAPSLEVDNAPRLSPKAAEVDALRRLLGLRERAPLLRPRARNVDRTLPGIEIDAGLWLIESQVTHAKPEAPLPLAFARRDGHVDADHLLFFDTETTGLAGGTGTRAFMIGAADWFDGALRVRQLLIANMAAEAAMLRTFASWLTPTTVLASYNGRSYDAPLLRTRYRLARQKDPLHGLDHLDLLHPSRRRWRGRWENCRLATIEREALRILREDDLPGSQAPAAWLTYLRGGASSNLRRVAEHNRQDVATLAQLLLRLCDDTTEFDTPS
ncbi:exonuclease [Lysobacter sp. TY2-98]|uniref:ribonuclease H-like domain-containing protein n=1 Tax=Lysobacter sp. TY2-98 TaxID=2290922 RepID=UPI000E207454|nr:ribonuclease H-like domain-containing protein [Lysobacter sp. TY2-98]AXK73287.1 exonuclease [Lysobacter sp. TY2-98]